MASGRDAARTSTTSSTGCLIEPDDWYGSSIGNIPIGQGISVTPIQMAAMYAAIANGGVLVEPHLVRGIEGEAPHRPTRQRIARAARSTASWSTC